MAVRAQKMGMRIMIGFHYSDSWADHSFAELLNDVYNHTYDVLKLLKKAGFGCR